MRYRFTCISRHAGMVFMIQKTQDEAINGGSPNASIAKLGLKNGPSMIEDEARVDDFCRQTVINRLATIFSYDLPYQKLDKVQSNSDRI